jgi:hypothetical protein
MGKADDYRKTLQSLEDWDAFLLKESRLPGPRGNLELAAAVAEEGTETQFLHWAAPGDMPAGFLAFCGVMGLGYLASRGGAQHFGLLRERASDPRWRVREAVAMGLQAYGQADPEGLLTLMAEWSRGMVLERRSVVATLCEPSLLKARSFTARTLDLLDRITASILDDPDRRSEEFRVLRQGLAYGWSVAVAAHPELGKPRMARWVAENDADIRWIMKQNLGKQRLVRMDAAWVLAQRAILDSQRVV